MNDHTRSVEAHQHERHPEHREHCAPKQNAHQDPLAEHRALATRTRLDVAPLTLLAGIVEDLRRATTDDDVDRAAAALAVLLSQLPHTHPLVVAARAGLEVGDLRREHRREAVATSQAIADGRDWRGYASRWVPYEEIARRRAQPAQPARVLRPTHRGESDVA